MMVPPTWRSSEGAVQMFEFTVGKHRKRSQARLRHEAAHL
jgi:hypothetical protein